MHNLLMTSEGMTQFPDASSPPLSVVETAPSPASEEDCSEGETTTLVGVGAGVGAGVGSAGASATTTVSVVELQHEKLGD